MSKPGVAKGTSRTSAKGARETAAAEPSRTEPRPQSRGSARPALLSGGNPQIAKAYGDAHVQAYIAAMPGWKSAVGRRLDALIELSRIPRRLVGLSHAASGAGSSRAA